MTADRTSATVGLVVPVGTTVTSTWDEMLHSRVVEDAICSTEKTGCVAGSGQIPAGDLSVERLSVRSRRGQPKSLHREKARDLRIAAAELIKTADAIDAMPPNALRHQQEREDIDPRAWVGLAERLVAGVKRGMGWE